ncbi:MAG TPA: ParB/RepB/Spo0J family partition protein [Limnochordales bacterium]
MSRRALGRGLRALIPAEGGDEPRTERLPLERIRPNRYQPRTEMDPAALQELAESIRTHGVLEPVIVRPVEGGYELVVGERRWRAAQQAGLTTIPSVIRELTDQEAAVLALVENLQREDLNPIEEARAFQRLTELGLTQEEVAAQVGRSRPAVANSLRLLTLEPEIQQAVARGEVSVGHAKVLLGVDNPALRRKLVAEIVSKGLTVRQTEELARSQRRVGAKAVRPARRGRPVDPIWADVETRLSEALGTRVRVQRQGEGGRIVIEFYTQEDVGRLLELLVPRGT